MLKRALVLLCGLVSSALASAQDPPPERLRRYRVGAPVDSRVTPRGPALVLMGGGRDVDAAFRWWRPFMAGGDVVVLRTSGGDGYNDYLLNEIGGCSSVETLLVTSPALARRPEVTRALRGAEAVFLAGGDQATYLAAWRDTPVQRELKAAWQRGAVLGGTSAGCAVLGELVFSAERGTIRSQEALADPRGPRVQLRRRFLRLPPLAGVLTDTHFSRRRRLGRLVAFLARAQSEGWGERPVGLGIDEATALVIDPRGKGAVLGRGCVSVVRLLEPGRVRAGEPLTGTRVEVSRLRAGHVLELPEARHALPTEERSVSAGQLSER